jgi:two-component system, cell cycle sensor histidine kinase and response regulator CckA
MSVQAVADQTGWQSKRVRRLPANASAYAAVVALGAAVAALATVLGREPTPADLTTFALLLPLAALSPWFRVSVGRNHGFHTGPAFVVAAALVLPPLLVVALVVAMQPAQWLRDRVPWYIQTFNLSNYVLSALAATAAVASVGGASDGRFALGGGAAVLAFVLVNHGLLAVMLRLGRGHSFRQSGLFSADGLAGDAGLAALGVAVGAFADFNPWLLPALLAPLALAHRSLSTVALLRKSEERFRTMFQSAPTAILMLGLDGRVLAVNRSCELLLGYDESELLGEQTPMLRHPDETEEIAAQLAELVSGERDSFRREARYVSKDGAVVVTQLAVALVRDADGKPDYVIAMAEDVTEQRHLEEQLRQSQKLEAIGRLAGGVAHDFNNMLTAIGGYTALALEHAQAGSSLHGDLEEIRKATDRAALLTRQLLAFSRKQVLMPELLNLNGVVLELETMLRPLIGEDVALATQLDPALGPIEADPGQLHQVVMNLVVNARDAMPAGGRISIETANADVAENDDAMEPGRYVTLTVRDTGEGIGDELLQQIFEPFFTTKPSGKGTGLGLATVYGIVKQSGGYVAVDSEVGVGSAFTIYLRRADGVVHQVEQPPAPLAPPEPPPSRHPEATTVLVVEDEDVIRTLVDQVLRGEGYDVLLAAHGDEAIELAEHNRVDVLLTDLTMPGIGGHELAARLRESRPGLKVMFMSGFAEGGDFSAAALPPATVFLEKPFTFTHLTERIRELAGVAEISTP